MKRSGVVIATLWLSTMVLTACQGKTPTAPGETKGSSSPSSVAAPAGGVHDDSGSDDCHDGCSSGGDNQSSGDLSARITASPTAIQAGQSSTLTWTTSDADHVYLNANEVYRSGTQTVSPSSTTTYDLVAVHDDHRATSSVTITVGSTATAPTATFTATPSSIQTGQSSVLAWNTTNATSVTLDGNPVSLNGTQTLSPTSTTTYTLVASNSAGSVTRTATVTVSATPPPVPMPTASLSANPTTITAGQSSTLSWTTTDATSVTMNGSPVAASGSQPYTPATTTTYTLVASNAAGSVTRQVTVTVNAAVPMPTASLAASPSSIMSGSSSTLSWNTTDATTVTLDGATVAATGRLSVSPTSTTTYTLVATNSTGSVTQTAIVTVTAPAPAPAITYLTNATAGQPSIKQIMDGNCIMCHGGPSPTAGRDFSTYQGVMTVVNPGDPNSRLIQMTQPGAPMHGYLQPDSAGRAQIIYDWIVRYGAKQQ